MIKKDEVVTSCLEFQNYYQVTIMPKKYSNTRIIPGIGRFLAVKKDFTETFEYYATKEDMKKVKSKFGKYIRELDEDEIDKFVKKIK